MDDGSGEVSSMIECDTLPDNLCDRTLLFEFRVRGA